MATGDSSPPDASGAHCLEDQGGGGVPSAGIHGSTCSTVADTGWPETPGGFKIGVFYDGGNGGPLNDSGGWEPCATRPGNLALLDEQGGLHRLPCDASGTSLGRQRADIDPSLVDWTTFGHEDAAAPTNDMISAESSSDCTTDRPRCLDCDHDDGSFGRDSSIACAMAPLPMSDANDYDGLPGAQPHATASP